MGFYEWELLYPLIVAFHYLVFELFKIEILLTFFIMNLLTLSEMYYSYFRPKFLYYFGDCTILLVIKTSLIIVLLLVMYFQ